MNGNYLVTLPTPKFESIWATGEFDNVDYYVLIAPIAEWSAAGFYDFLSIPADGLIEQGWGIVTLKTIIYVYADYDMAQRRAKIIGGRVKTLKLECLSCFFRILSNTYAYTDIVLNEAWHIKSYLCRNSNDSEPGVYHLRLSTPNNLFEMQGCKNTTDLVWTQYPSYAEPNHPIEWDCPVPFPGVMAMYDHAPQGGTAVTEILVSAESLEYYMVDGVELAISKDNGIKTIFTRPTGPGAFSGLQSELIRITSGEGVWAPLASLHGENWLHKEWASSYKPYIDKILNNKYDKKGFDVGCVLFLNKAMTILENTFLADVEATDDLKAKSLAEATELLEKATRINPWNYYIKNLYYEITNFSMKEIPAVVHNNRIAWLITSKRFNEGADEYKRALNAKSNYAVAMHTAITAFKEMNQMELFGKALEGILKLQPNHAMTLFDLAIMACHQGNEAQELEFYEKAMKADPNYAPPFYNTGKTHEDNGNLDLAKQFYRKTLSINPYYIEAAEQLAFILLSEQKASSFREGFDLLLEAIEYEPRRTNAYIMLLKIADKMHDDNLKEMVMNKLRGKLPRLFIELEKQGFSKHST